MQVRCSLNRLFISKQDFVFTSCNSKQTGLGENFLEQEPERGDSSIAWP